MACPGCGYSSPSSGRESYSPLSLAESPGASYSHRQKYDNLPSAISDSILGIKYDSSSVKYNSNNSNSSNPSGNYSSLLSPDLDYHITKITEAEKSKSESESQDEQETPNTPNQNTSLQRIDTPNSGELIPAQPEDQQIIELLQNQQLADRNMDNEANLPVKHASLTQIEIQEEITLIRKRKTVKKSLTF
ncbi:MAG: hypothetical protein QF506_04005 [Candidatus Woesearchaeota archaeon]|jgi:hypothetical protein|nr:hypothetical protein [Candidatus Woesearchaeota archaeon]|tara:strand:+ start:1086 stop:1655 length:570 start_codon:yes stop_codon:yes gene_type:complete